MLAGHASFLARRLEVAGRRDPRSPPHLFSGHPQEWPDLPVCDPDLRAARTCPDERLDPDGVHTAL